MIRLAISILLGSALSLSAATLFVSTSGDNTTGNGSIGTPWRTIAFATSQMTGGDTLNIRGGVYVETTWLNQSANWKSGTISNPTRIQAYNNESSTIRPNDPNALFVAEIKGSSNIVFSGLYLDNSLARLDIAGTSVVKTTDGAREITFTNCVMANAPRGMGWLTTVGSGSSIFSNHRILSCTFTNIAWDHQAGDSPPHCVYLQTSSNIVDRCVFEAGGQDFAVHNFAAVAVSNVVSRCLFRNGDRGVGLVSGGWSKVFNNVFHSNAGVAVTVNYGHSTNLIANNTIYGGPGGIMVFASTNNVIENNIITACSGNWSLVLATDSYGTVIRNNLVCQTPRYSVPLYVGILGSVASNSGNLFGDSYFPVFTSPPATLTLERTSSAIDSGVTQSSFSDDYLGVLRPKLAAWDIGAYEYSPVTNTAASPSRTHVLAAYALCNNGDTLAIPAGTATWTDQIVMAKNITIKGAGITATTLTNGIGVSDWHGLKPLFYVTASGLWKFQDINFEGRWTAGGKGIVAVSGTGRIARCRFKQCYDRGVQTFSTSFGVIDHCIFIDCWSSASFYGNQYTSWTQPTWLGTTNCWVMEDNYDLKTGAVYAPVGSDGAWGARYVWRYNILSNVGLAGFDYALDAHGNQGKPFGDPSTSIAGNIFLEAYNNTLSLGQANRGGYYRGGTQIQYGNAYSATGGNMVTFGTVFMFTEEDGYRYGSPIKTAWPGYQGTTNSYLWANTFNGAAVTAANLLLDNPGTTPCLDPNGCGPDWPSDGIFIQQNRDWFLNAPTTNFYRPLAYPHPRIVAENDPPIPTAFTLTSPANGAMGQSLAPTLVWTGSSGHYEYRLIVSRSFYMTDPVWDITMSPGSLSYTMPSGVLSNSLSYYWLMRAVGTNGVITSTSAPFVFTVGTGTAIPGSIQLLTNAYSINENAGTLGAVLRRVGGSDGAVSVSYGTTAGTAVAGVNYTATSGTQNWGSGDSANKTINIPIIDDGVYQSTLQFTFGISTPIGGATLGTPTNATVSVLNVNAPPAIPLVTYPTFNAYEGLITAPGLTNAAGEFYQASETSNPVNGGRVAFRVDLPTTNLYRIRATVRAPTTSNNSFFIDWNNDPPATPSAIWSISPLTAATGLESRYVSWLGNGTSQNQFPTNVWALDAGTNTLYIRGREANTFIDEITIEPVPVPGTISLSASAYSVNENVTPLTITARRTGGSDGIVGVSYATANGTAISGVNYTGTSGTLSWADGDSANKTFTVTIIDDGVYGPDLQFTTSISTPTGGASISTPTSATVNVLNVNPPPPSPDPGDIQYAVASQSVSESAGSTTVVMRRVDGTNGIVGISYETQDISAVAGVNYTTASGTESWADGSQTDQTFTVTILDDGVYTTNLTFRVIAHTPTGGAGLGTPTTNVITILNVNPPVTPPVPQFFAWSEPGYAGPETTTPLVLIVDRLGDTNGTISVNYATSDGTAVAGVNYTATSGTLTMTNGVTALAIPVTIIDNSAWNGNDFFYMTLSNPVGATVQSPATALAVIEDDEQPPQTTVTVIGKAKLKKAVIGPRVP